MKDNPVVIFPELNLQAWDRLPRFAFLDANLKKCQQINEEQTIDRKHQNIKSNFIGSPIRTQDEGGVLIKT